MPNVIVVPWLQNDPRRVELPVLLSNDYMYGKADALIQGEKKTDICTYLSELNYLAQQKNCPEVLHIASPDTVSQIEAYLAGNFSRFPFAIFTTCSKSIGYVIYPNLSNQDAILYLASVMKG
jgi:hypothetical protein